MNSKLALGFALTAVACLSGSIVIAGGKPKIKPSVTYAKSWEAAVEEGKLLNLPLVVHSHGFY
ncbi:MAG: hypothetical protein IPH13_10040 [Planctomycetes bacterium]|nr:hypothetical protein [Planctomycetota bacterium]MCC7169867.1 hypothetical protein [Planctomycetota bacterium]